jgi:hypothetical protein
MSIVEFVDYTNDNIKIINKEDINQPFNYFFLDFSEEEEYPIKKVYFGPTELFLSNTNIIVEDYIYNADYEILTVYPVSINGINNFILKKGIINTEEELINEIKLQNKAAEFGFADPILFAYIFENENEYEYGIIMKKYEQTLFRIFDSEYYTLEDKQRYLDRIKIILNDLEKKVKICHGNFNLWNIMVDENNHLKLIDFEKGYFLDSNSKKFEDMEIFTKYGLILDTISEQVSFDLENYWYDNM